ncbi:MAG TPA: ABC transporter permease [Candidatus Ventricola gallistercoris]|nr:ABC transporter permease [Candidatus Ventricola gallistercoris]
MDNKQAQKASLGGRLASSEAFLSVAASLICIVIGLALGVLVLAIINAQHAIGDGLLVILQSGSKSARNMGTVLANAAPLVMTGLSVGFAFKTGLFNIGAAGQYTLGAFGALYCAIVLQLPWYLCLLAAMIFGALWGAIPGIFKAYLNINEVITAIMFNWIGLYMVNDIMYGKGKSVMYDLTTTKTYSLRKIAPQSMIPSCGMSDLFGKLQSVTIAIFIAIFFAIIIYIVLNKTTFGYELRACGFNKNAAKYAGINDKRNIIVSMMIAGALAGVGAGLYYLSTVAEWNPQVSTALPAMGFNGISSALLACSNPIGTIFSSLFISYITVGGTKLSTQYYTKEIADVITALIIYLCAFSLLFKNKIRALLAGKKRAVTIGKGRE